MSAKISLLIKNVFKIMVLILAIPIIGHIIEFVLQLGRITGTLVRIIMSL